MPTEYEHKLLVAGDGWRAAVESSSSLSQAYLCTQPGLTVRVRVVDERIAYLTIKGRQAGIGRPEYEYQIPVDDAHDLLGLARDGYPISKTRYELGEPWPGWIVDEFEGENAGLVVAELEVPSEDTSWDVPAWAGEDVTTDKRYTNALLYATPYTHW